MRKVVYYAAMSLDGFIAETDDTLDWLMSYDGSYEGADAEPMRGSYDRFYEEVGALVSGSVTYEFILGLMEKGSDWLYPRKPYWVLSSRDLPVPLGEGIDVRIVNNRVGAVFEEMVGSAGDRSLWVVGGGNVASQFADEGLLEDVLVHVVPVVLGDGKPLFDRRLPEPPMRLTGVVPRDNGMVELRYEIVR